MIGQFNHGGIGWETREKFVISHWWVSIRLLLVKLVEFGPSIVSQIKSVCLGLFVGFV